METKSNFAMETEQCTDVSPAVINSQIISIRPEVLTQNRAKS